jgi:serine/threonine protein kinase
MSTPTHPHSENDLDFGPTLRGMREGLKVFERYTLVRQVGRGGMGVVWLARDGKLDLDVALKLLPESLWHDEVAVSDLRRETKRCMKLSHTNIVRVFDLVDDGSTAAIVMEYVEGRTLSRWRLEQDGRVLQVQDILNWLGQLEGALTYAHEEARIVHRDLKPANLMLTRNGVLKVMDFGIASSLSESISRVSRGGQMASAGGTLPYMSPQQVSGFPPSVADDVYSLGATLYELLTGKPPFFRGNLPHQIETIVPPSLVERRAELGVVGAGEISEVWERMVAACLEKDSRKRPLTVKEAVAPVLGIKEMDGVKHAASGEAIGGFSKGETAYGLLTEEQFNEIKQKGPLNYVPVSSGLLWRQKQEELSALTRVMELGLRQAHPMRPVHSPILVALATTAGKGMLEGRLLSCEIRREEVCAALIEIGDGLYEARQLWSCRITSDLSRAEFMRKLYPALEKVGWQLADITHHALVPARFGLESLIQKVRDWLPGESLSWDGHLPAALAGGLIYSANIRKVKGDFLVLDCLPKGLGVQTPDGRVWSILKGGASIPQKGEQIVSWERRPGLPDALALVEGMETGNTEVGEIIETRLISDEIGLSVDGQTSVRVFLDLGSPCEVQFQMNATATQGLGPPPEGTARRNVSARADHNDSGSGRGSVEEVKHGGDVVMVWLTLLAATAAVIAWLSNAGPLQFSPQVPNWILLGTVLSLGIGMIVRKMRTKR